LTSRPVPSALLGRRAFVTDGGIETDLIYRRGATLPEFAAFPLLDTADGREMLRSYYDDYAAIARASGRGLISSG
jgi:homocysteine S-methyltransferase